MFMKIPCSKCSKIFDTYPYKAKRHKHLFCSTVCQYEFKKTSIVIACRICSKNFQAKAYRVRDQKECFCSKKCADKALEVPKIISQCKTCGAEIRFHVSKLKHTNRGYCSPKCFHVQQRTSIFKKCEACEKEFLVPPSAIRYKRGRFCSRECYVKFCVKEKNHAFKHGHGWFKKMSRKTRSNFCQICEKECKTDIHHIDGNERNNEESNFITLCRSCHMRVHHLSGRQSIPIEKALHIFKSIRLLPKNSHSTWELVEKLKLD